MSTGYTADIKEGISFEKFAMNCARAFGACVTMRNEPNGIEIPEEFQPSKFYGKNLIEAKAALDSLLAMTESECDDAAQKEYQQELDYINKHISESRELENKYFAMLASVRAWVPPTKDHDGLKSFMIEQIESSVKYDCDVKYLLDEVVVPLSGKQWFEKENIKRCGAIAEAEKSLREETERIKVRNQWVKRLRESLGNKVGTINE